MNTTYHLSNADLATLVSRLTAAGTRVVAPSRMSGGEGHRELHGYRVIRDVSQAALGGPLPQTSLKEFFLPPTEPVVRWTRHKDDVVLEEVPTTFPPTLILGARACDAAAVLAVDKVMDWDYHDELWFGRRNATTVATLACDGGDSSCFCTAVGLAPDSPLGSDLLLTPEGQGYDVQTLTPKGEAFVAAQSDLFKSAQASPAAKTWRDQARARVEGRHPIAAAEVSRWLSEHFEDDFWSRLPMACHGCGVCASLCPTCHCFDIVDEPEGVLKGVRRRNWDTCQTSKFTIHGSGHNPRADQNSRMRQRVMHKFHIYPTRFGQLLCTGCGRCARACPGGMNLPEVLEQLSRMAVGSKEGAA